MARFKFLSKSERRILTAFAETLLPRGGAFEVGAPDVDYLPFLDRYVGAQDVVYRVGIRYLIHQWNWLPLLYLKSVRPFTAMSHEDRTVFLRYVQESKYFLQRSNAVVFRLMTGMAIYSDPRIEKAMGYEPHCDDLLPAGEAGAGDSATAREAS